MLVIFNLGCSGAILIGVPTLAKLDLGAGAQGAGILLGSLGAGAFVGALAMVALPGVPRPGRLACLAIGVIGLGLVGAGTASSLWVAAAWLAISGLGSSSGAVALLTLVQTHTPAETRGRVMALWTLGLSGLTPASYAVSGALSDVLGARGVLIGGGACVLAAAAFGASWRSMRQAG
jgi:MFS family permease